METAWRQPLDARRQAIRDNLEDNINNYTDGVNATVQGEKNEIHVALEALYRCSGK